MYLNFVVDLIEKTVNKLFPIENTRNRIPGRLEGKIVMSRDFDENEEIIELFYEDEKRQ